MRTLFMLLALYVGTYAYLSANGRYQASSTGGSVAAQSWHPKGCELSLRRAGGQDRYNVDGNKLGLVFMPAIVVDRRFVHRDRSLI